MGRRLSFPVASDALLEAMASASRPLGMSAARPGYRLLRETYFDTHDGALRERRMSLRLRLDATGTQTLALATVSTMNLEGVVEETVLEEPLSDTGVYASLAADTELATRLREIADPVALRPVVAVDIDREERDLRARWLGSTAHRVCFDRIVAHAPGVTRSFQEVVVTELGGSGPPLETMAERLRVQHGVSSDGLDTLERARRILAASAGSARPETPHEVRGAFLIVQGGAVALVEGAASLTLPTARGSGEEPARTFLAEVLGDEHPFQDLELIGFAQTPREAPDLEVWLHEVHAGAVPGGFLWLPLPELLERVGQPRLRDPGLSAALLLLVRSEVGRRLLRETPRPEGPPTRIPVAEGDEGGDAPVSEAFLDTELSILDFNQRVLELAEDDSVPLLERFRFLSIFASNMDEFFVVRVGRLKTESGAAPAAESALAAHLLDNIAIRARALLVRQYACLTDRLLPALEERGIRLRRWASLDDDERAGLESRFHRDVFPLLTPRAMSAAPGHPFPRLTSLGLSLAAILRAPQAGEEQTHLAHVPIPEDMPRFLLVGEGPDLVALEEVVEANAAALFPSFDVQEVHAFRVSRLGDVEIDEDGSESLLAAVEDEVEARPYKPVVRIEVQESMPREVRAHLLRELRSERGTDSAVLSRADVYEVDGPLDLRGFAQLADLDLAADRFAPFTPRRPLDPERSIFDVLAEGDVLVHHPFDAFDATVGRFLEEAARDPAVVSIKLTVYRTGRESPLAAALVEALRHGKEVSAFVELKARFDEESNIHWTHRLTEAGGHVVYGLVGLKTHAKTALVVRREEGGLRRYVHVGTGNYNASTARFYTDLGLLSADPELGADLADFFNELTGAAGPPTKTYRRLWVAPTSLASNLLRCIEREAAHARAGRPARIQAKMNGITDRKTVKALYRAARDGVSIDLVVRAVCTLRPGVPGLSENISVRSILGRFLEHARIVRFENGGEPEFYIGSADWRRRNLHKRVEVLAPVRGEGPKARLQEILDAELGSARAWILRPDGAYERSGGEGEEAQVRFLPRA